MELTERIKKTIDTGKFVAVSSLISEEFRSSKVCDKVPKRFHKVSENLSEKFQNSFRIALE